MSKIDDKLDRFFLLGWIEDSGRWTDKERKETNQLRKEFKSALKLQELVKESTKEGNPPTIAGYLLKLVEESEK